ncbi:hypothetical protein CCY99_07815 [Helicobacter sp. 16-1353]|uniref:hypothetical protein n=1 Tax=Helicobacter sp. 16-1353 TaxID=2004996 RepID=UPI000DCC587B|nr:hypothetical protein [Helicobacter sp. 16-1353]RAX52048.1 hypothetical protein CCY99_07815 [Helicobacter sp. 16-1353]
MKLFIIILIAILVGSTLYFLFKNKFNKRNRIILSILFIVILIIIGIYTFMQDGNNKKDADIIASFLRGESVECGDLTINQQNFTFINGTLSFVGKKDTKFFGKTIPIEQCY